MVRFIGLSEIYRIILSKSLTKRRKVADQFKRNSPILYDKNAWDNLHMLTYDKDGYVRRIAAEVIGSAFLQIPDKIQAWNDLHRLTQDNDKDVRGFAAQSIGLNFSHLPDKEQAWNYFHKLIIDGDRDFRHIAAHFLGYQYSRILNKEQAWKDLQKLVQDVDKGVQLSATLSVGFAFSYLPDKEQAWNDLHKLTQSEDLEIRRFTAQSIGYAFSQIPYKEQAWNDLQKLQNPLTSYKPNILYNLFPPLRHKIFYQINRITVVANYSLGNASIFRATIAENRESFKKELENAINFFKLAAGNYVFKDCPANFCYPFYESIYAITFLKKIDEIPKYKSKMKNILESSESKEKLMGAVENLAGALREIQYAKEMDFESMKYDLTTYMRYLERAAELLDETAGRAPLATKLIKKGLPIIEENIKEILSEINKNAKILCDSAKNTEVEKYANPICKEVKEFTRIRNPIELEKRVYGLIPNLNFMVENLPERERHFINNKIENIRSEEYLEDIVVTLNEIIVFIAPHIKKSIDMEALEKKLDEIKISLKPGISEELVLSVGAEFAGTGAKHEIHIPLQEIAYSDIKKDLENIKEKNIFKLVSLPAKLAAKVREYLIRNKKDELLKYLS